MEDRSFGEIELHRGNLDQYPMRTVIYKSIKLSLPVMFGNLLDSRCGKILYKDEIIRSSSVTRYTGIDIQTDLAYSDDVRPDIVRGGNELPFANGKVNAVLATEVLEHCPDLEQIFSQVFRVTASGGCFIFTVLFLWPLHEIPDDEARYFK